MLGPSMHSTHLSHARHAQHLDHAARIREVQRERQHGSPVTSLNHRLITVRRLAGAKLAALVRAVSFSPTANR